MTIEEGNLDVDVFWSMRSPYCYISLDRCIELQKMYLRAGLRGQGWAERLAEKVEDRAREAEASGLELWTDTRFARTRMLPPRPEPRVHTLSEALFRTRSPRRSASSAALSSPALG